MLCPFSTYDLPFREPGNGIPEAGRDSHEQPAAGLQEGARSLLFANHIANTDKVSLK